VGQTEKQIDDEILNIEVGMQFGMDSLMIGFDQTSLCVIKEMPDKKLKKVTHHNLRLDKYFL
jgi:hypothetical protein